MAFETCYQQLSEFAKEEFRESDILGSMGENRLVAILPYGNRSAGTRAKFHFESCLKYYDFKKEGYEVQIHEICFPEDGTGISDLVKKLLGSEAR